MYVAADRKGGLHFSNSLDFDKSTCVHLFMNKRFSLVNRKQTLIASTDDSNVIMLKAKVPEQPSAKVWDSIVMIEKE